ncbi:MAG: hypothetical protein AAB495_02640 [Patescibacteria group bacterium]
MEKLDSNIPIIRHLEDQENILKFGRDGDLVPGQEEAARRIGEKILEDAKREKKGAIMLVCSNKKRSTQTAHLVVGEIKKIESSIKTRIVQEDRLAPIDEGGFVLPADYREGETFEGLPLANKAFNKEAFDEANDLYRFGDPVLRNDGTYKYPELVPYFKSYGESNRDLMIRIYELIIETTQKIDKFDSRTKVFVVTHSQLYQIFRNLMVVAKMIKTEGLKFETGEVPRLCWNVYQSRTKQEKPTYEANLVPIDDLRDPEIIELLKKEIEYLKNLT